MSAVIGTVQQDTLDLDTLRSRMKAKGITVTRLARLAEMEPNNLGAILSGRTYLGEKRRARLIMAVRALGLDDEAQSA